jgi:hypothetical protein
MVIARATTDVHQDLLPINGHQNTPQRTTASRNPTPQEDCLMAEDRTCSAKCPAGHQTRVGRPTRQSGIRLTGRLFHSWKYHVYSGTMGASTACHRCCPAWSLDRELVHNRVAPAHSRSPAVQDESSVGSSNSPDVHRTVILNQDRPAVQDEALIGNPNSTEIHHTV